MIPRTSIARNDGFVVREDWIKNVGLSLPENREVTLDEFTEILKRFTKNDPDGNDIDDTYGFTGKMSNDNSLFPIVTDTFDLKQWQKYEGEEYPYMDLKYSRVSDNFKKALEYTAQLWKEGLIDPDWPVNKGTTHDEKVHRGEAGMKEVFAGHVQNVEIETQKINPDAQYTYIVGIKNDEGVIEGSGNILGIWMDIRLPQVLKSQTEL